MKYLILGTMRSGSSALAGVMQRLGLRLHEDLMPPDPLINPKGFYESTLVQDFNDSVLAELGTACDSWLPLPRKENWPPNVTDWAPHMHKLETIQRLVAPVDVVKVPSVALLLPFWVEALRRMGEPFQIILTHRPWDEVVASMMHMNSHYSPNAALCHYIMWVSTLLENLASCHYQRLPTRVRYCELMRDWRTVLPPALGLEGFHFAGKGAKEQEVDRFLEKRTPRSLGGLHRRVMDHALMQIAGGLDDVLLGEVSNTSYRRSQARRALLQRMGWSHTMSCVAWNEPEYEEDVRYALRHNHKEKLDENHNALLIEREWK